MNRIEVYLLLILIISLLSLWFSWKTYSRGMKCGMKYRRRYVENYKYDCNPGECPLTMPDCCGGPSGPGNCPPSMPDC